MSPQLGLQLFSLLFTSRLTLVEQNGSHALVDAAVILFEAVLEACCDWLLKWEVGRCFLGGEFFLEVAEPIGELLHGMFQSLKVLVVLAVEVVDGWGDEELVDLCVQLLLLLGRRFDRGNAAGLDLTEGSLRTGNLVLIFLH